MTIWSSVRLSGTAPVSPIAFDPTIWEPTDPGELQDTQHITQAPAPAPLPRPFTPMPPLRSSAAPTLTPAAPVASPPAAPLPAPRAAQIGNRYVLERQLGAGGLGTVWAAHDGLLNRRVAVKTLTLSTPGHERPSLVLRVLEEARTAARLNHPHIVTVHDAGISPEGAYIAMELLRGTDLSHMLRSGWRPSFEQIALIVRRVADALSYAHGKGVIHCDIKPANIFMVGRTRPMVLDFGIAQLLNRSGSANDEPTLGSPFYAAPEQFDGRDCDPRTDVYSLGVVLYELLTRQRPFVGTSVHEIRAAVRQNRPRHPQDIDPKIPNALANIALQAIRLEPQERQRTAGQLARELRMWLASQPGAAAQEKEPAPVTAAVASTATTAPPASAVHETPPPLTAAVASPVITSHAAHTAVTQPPVQVLDRLERPARPRPPVRPPAAPQPLKPLHEPAPDNFDEPSFTATDPLHERPAWVLNALLACVLGLLLMVVWLLWSAR